MPIEALPLTTIRAIGSTSVISDPCSVVKELVDNALDASASSLFLEISSNTLDVIQLRDNGLGINADDYPNVCKHTFTSKIQTIHDLKNVGGTSLGFRGEALASVAELSGAVTVTTRVASDITGSCLQYARDGELSHSQRASHPVGTTVRIADFLKHIPVRRQTALKAAAKSLSKVKKLLQAYAIALPSTRFSLKVLKSKNENKNWLYAPSQSATLAEAAVKIMGKEVSTSCVMKTIQSDVISSSDSETGGSDYELAAFLPRPDADFSKISNMGQFISVDGRPLTSDRGIGSEIAKLFKSYLRAAWSRAQTSRTFTDPFGCLQIKCPPGSYDVNIEPSKDDILFGDKVTLFSLINCLFCNQYGPLPDIQKRSPIEGKAASLNYMQADGGFDLLMARKRPEATTEQLANPGSSLVDEADSGSVSRRMSCPRDSILPAPPVRDRQVALLNGPYEQNQERKSRFINPWSIAKINASFQVSQNTPFTQPKSSQTASHATPEQRQYESSTAFSSRPLANGPELPSPPVSRFASTSPVGHRRDPPIPRPGPPKSIDSSIGSRKAARERDRELYGNGALDTWFQRTTQISLGQDLQVPNVMRDNNATPSSELMDKRFSSHDETLANNNVEESENTPATDARPADCEPRLSPEDTQDGLPVQSNRESRPMDSGRGFPVLESWAAKLREGFAQKTSPDLDWALDFERRKKDATQQHRLRRAIERSQSSYQVSSVSSQTPHPNRYLAAKAALAAESTRATEATSASYMSLRDPRAYLIRHRNERFPENSSNEGTKARRLHTSRLPLERIPEGNSLHDTCLRLKTDSADITRSFKVIGLLDGYVQCGKDAHTFHHFKGETLIPLWNARLAALINEQYRAGKDSEYPGWQIDLSSVIVRHDEDPQAP